MGMFILLLQFIFMLINLMLFIVHFSEISVVYSRHVEWRNRRDVGGAYIRSFMGIDLWILKKDLPIGYTHIYF